MRRAYLVSLVCVVLSVVQGQVITREYNSQSDCFWEVLKFQNSQFLAKIPFYLPETIPYLPSYLSSENLFRGDKQTYRLCPNFYDYLMRLDPQLKPYLYPPQASLRLVRERIQDSLVFFDGYERGHRKVCIVGGNRDSLGNALERGIKALYLGTDNHINKVPQLFQEKALFSYPCHSLLKGPEVINRLVHKNDSLYEDVYCVYLYVFDTNENSIDCLGYIEKLEQEALFGEKHSIIKLIFKEIENNKFEYLGQILISGEILKCFDNLGRPFHQIFQF